MHYLTGRVFCPSKQDDISVAVGNAGGGHVIRNAWFVAKATRFILLVCLCPLSLLEMRLRALFAYRSSRA